MNEDDLEAQKLEIMRALATFRNGKTYDVYMIHVKCDNLFRFTSNKPTFYKVLDLLVKEFLVRIIPYDVETSQRDVYELTEKAKTKYGIDVSDRSYHIPREREPEKYVNSAGQIVGTKKAMTKGDFRAILVGICIVTIMAIPVLIFLG
jgi:hypothetical protein